MEKWANVQSELNKTVWNKSFLDILINAEEDYGTTLQIKYSGFRKTLESIFSLFDDILQHISNCPDEILNSYIGFQTWLGSFIATIKDFRATYVLFSSGYTVQSIPILRGITERLTLMSCAIHKIEPYNELINIRTKSESTDYKQFLKDGENKRRTARKKFFSQLVDEDSSNHIKEITDSSSEQTHYGLWSLFASFQDIIANKCTLLPIKNTSSEMLYLNRSCEFSLMLVRLSCFLQFKNHQFDDNLKNKWKICNDAIFILVSNIATEQNPNIGKYFATYTNDKFNFNVDNHFFENYICHC